MFSTVIYVGKHSFIVAGEMAAPCWRSDKGIRRSRRTRLSDEVVDTMSRLMATRVNIFTHCVCPVSFNR